MCWCWDDRTISLQPWSQLVAACGNGNRSNSTIEPFVHEIECNCSAGVTPEETSGPNSIGYAARFVGAMRNMIPYEYYKVRVRTSAVPL